MEKTSELTSLHHDHSTSNSTSSSSRGSGGGSGSTRSNYLSSSSSLGGMSPQLLSSASALCSPSTFYSHQQHLFSPPTATISSSQQGTHSNTGEASDFVSLIFVSNESILAVIITIILFFVQQCRILWTPIAIWWSKRM
mgnify:CR=1 FL=1